jgi:hypothetical protein
MDFCPLLTQAGKRASNLNLPGYLLSLFLL